MTKPSVTLRIYLVVLPPVSVPGLVWQRWHLLVSLFQTGMRAQITLGSLPLVLSS